MDRSDKLETLLIGEGLSVYDAAARLKVSPRWVYRFADKRNLPTNPTITPNGTREKQILRALVATRMDIAAVGKVFKQAPVNIEAIITRISQEEKLGPSPR